MNEYVAKRDITLEAYEAARLALPQEVFEAHYAKEEWEDSVGNHRVVYTYKRSWPVETLADYTNAVLVEETKKQSKMLRVIWLVSVLELVGIGIAVMKLLL